MRAIFSHCIPADRTFYGKGDGHGQGAYPLTALFEGLACLEGGAKLTLHYTDVAPPAVMLAVTRFHHIIPYSEGGPSDHDNIAPVCKDRHRRIRTLSLQEFRDKLNLDRFFEDSCKKPDGVRLRELIR